MSTTRQLMSKIDEIKQKMSTQDYLDLCNLLKKKSEEENEDNIWEKLFVVKYFEQSVNLNNEQHSKKLFNDISCERKSIICKFKKSDQFRDDFSDENDINIFIDRINDNEKWDYPDYDISFITGKKGMNFIRKDRRRFTQDIVIPGMVNNEKVHLKDLGVYPNELSFRKYILYSIEEYKSEE